MPMPSKKNKPKLVVFDLETLPDLDLTMKHYTELSDYPGKTMNATTSSIICFGYKIIGDQRAKCISAWDFPKAWKKNVNDDYYVVKRAREILEDADGIITHNGVKFDLRVLNTRLTHHGLAPLPKIAHMDTCQVARKKLRLVNNRLNTVASHFDIEQKMDTGGWELWRKVLNRQSTAQKTMAKYCKKDVDVTEQVFENLRPLFNYIPNYNLFIDDQHEGCPACGSSKLKSRGWRHTKTRSYRRLLCLDCHTYSRTDAKGEKPRSF